MKPGDLRKFKDRLFSSTRAEELDGRPFMVLEASFSSSWVTLLIDGRIERMWSGDWVEQHSEVVDEAG